jgi:prophage maintenance system killer protein
VDVYPSLEEKVANFLYFVSEDFCFLDGNKKIATI